MPSRAGRWQAAGRPRWPSTWTRQVRQAPRGARSGSLQSCGSVIPRRFTASNTVAPGGTSTAVSSTVTCTVAEFIGDPISPDREPILHAEAGRHRPGLLLYRGMGLYAELRGFVL